MGLIETFKASGIRIADQLNKLNDPFDDFTRPALSPAQKKLSELETEFYEDLVANFWGCEGQVLLHRIPLPTGSPLDMGDQAIWHGIFTGVLALKYHLQGSGAEGSDKNDSALYGHLVEAAKGLQLHQTIHGEGSPRLIRGISDDLKTWQDDASNDSATGHVFGIYALWKWGPPSLRPVCEQLALGLASELLGHGHALVDASGKPTTYGALEQGWQTDPLRITLALAIYAVGATLTRQPAFMKAYSDLYERYHRLAEYPKASLWWLDNKNDTHRAAIHLAILADLTHGEPRQGYVWGLERLRRMVRKHGNVWVNALCSWGGYGWAPDNRNDAVKVLSEFTLTEKQINNGVDNSTPERERQLRVVIPSFRRVHFAFDKKLYANQPLPRFLVRAQDFFWQRGLFSLDPGSAGAAPDSRLNGGDFLAAYWMSRLAGVLTEKD